MAVEVPTVLPSESDRLLFPEELINSLHVDMCHIYNCHFRSLPVCTSSSLKVTRLCDPSFGTVSSVAEIGGVCVGDYCRCLQVYEKINIMTLYMSSV